MFKSAPVNPYDDIVVKATDETLTGENWETILNLCDKVQEEGEQGARNVIAAILKRLAHRNPNVQLYSLTLTESLSKNCGKELHSEIASRAFTQALERLITDRTSHDKVRNRALMLIAMWTEDFASDPTLGVMEECYESLKAKNYKFEPSMEPSPNDDDETRRREEEELQRVLELSMQDKGGRRNWNEYSLASSSSAGGSSSQASTHASTAHPPAAAPSSSSSAPAPAPAYNQHAYSTGFVPSTETHSQATAPPVVETSSLSTSTAPTSPTSSTTEGYAVTRVRALHSFEPTEPNELAFDKGDIIKVVNREYKDWWRGQIRGRTGIFPVNYVEPLPEPTTAELAAEAQQEAAVFSQAANVDRLLTMLRTLDPAKDNLADNEEIQELYRSCMSLRPKIVKLIDKYSQKRADLVSMNESFVRARTVFDRMMEESLARHSEFYDQQRPAFPQPQSVYPRPEPRGPGQQAPGYGRPADQPPQAYAWNTSTYDQTRFGVFPDTAAAYTQPRPDPRVNLGRSASYAAGQFQSQRRPQVQPPSQQAQQVPQLPQAYSQPYPAQDNPGASYYTQAQPQQPEAPPQPDQTQTPSQPQTQQQPQVQLPQPHPQPQHSPRQPQLQSQVPAQVPAPAQPQVQTQNVMQQQHPAQAQAPHSPVEAHSSVQSLPQAQAQKQQQQQTMTGPPFVFDPNATYPDPNMQAWAQYYAQGGTDPTGSVYFISVPGITNAQSSPTIAAAVQPGVAGGQQQQATSTATSFSGSGSGSESDVAAPGHIVTQGLQRQNSLPNPYGLSNESNGGETMGSFSAGLGGPGMAAPWDTTATGAATTTTTSLPGHFAQMRVGEPSVGA